MDDNCEWNFSTSGPTISLNPTSGTVLPVTSVTVTGNGFAPISSVVITFEGSTVASVTSNSNGGFISTFIVPFSSSNGDTAHHNDGGTEHKNHSNNKGHISYHVFNNE